MEQEQTYFGYTVEELYQLDYYTLFVLAAELGVDIDEDASVDALVEAITC